MRLEQSAQNQMANKGNLVFHQQQHQPVPWVSDSCSAVGFAPALLLCVFVGVLWGAAEVTCTCCSSFCFQVPWLAALALQTLQGSAYLR